MKWLLVALLIALLAVVFAPWQALQTNWIVPPSDAVRIHWHQCLSAGGATVILTNSQMIWGFVVEDASPSDPLLVRACQ
jgi:hypothetical protein